MPSPGSRSSPPIVALLQRRRAGSQADELALAEADPTSWRMPPLAQLPRPVWSTARKVGMLVLRAYLFLAVILMVVKIVQLALGHRSRGQPARVEVPSGS
jgi:hypothetical protein